MNVVADEAGIDWIGCQVLVVVPRSHADLASSVVRRVRRAIQDDPLLVDMARVGVTVGPDDWTDDPDQVARVLRQELVSWTMSPAAVRASRIVFGILLLHDDLAEAERFIDTLAGTEAMSTLPVAFRSAALPAGTRPTDEPSAVPATPDGLDDVLELAILNAVTATAGEADATPAFSLTPAMVASLAAPAREPSRSGADPARVSTRSSDSRPVPVAEPVVTSIGDDGRGRSSLGMRRPLRRRRDRAANNIQAIDDLSVRARSVSIAYIILASEPVRLGRAEQRRRSDVAVGMAGRLLTRSRSDPMWHVRAFTADDRLGVVHPLPPGDRLARGDFPFRWGRYFDFYEVGRDVVDQIGREALSFRRRGVETLRVVVILLVGSCPEPGPDTVGRLAELSAIAETYWVAFGPDEARSDRLERLVARARVIDGHEDVTDELIRLVLATPSNEHPGLADPAGTGLV